MSLNIDDVPLAIINKGNAETLSNRHIVAKIYAGCCLHYFEYINKIGITRLKSVEKKDRKKYNDR
jgi:hypothetical protein